MSAASVDEPRPPKGALVRVEDVEFHPRNVRRDLGDLREMTNSIARFGVMQPIIVEAHGRKLRLRAGHRRLAAARLAGLARIPALVHAEALPEGEWIVQALHENTMRRNLDPGERADALKRLRVLGHTWREIAESLGISEATAHKWATGQTSLVVVDIATGATISAPPAAPSTVPPPAPRPIERSVSCRPMRRKTVVSADGIRRFVEAWSRAPDVTAEQILTALRLVVDGKPASEAMPPEHARPEGAA